MEIEELVIKNYKYLNESDLHIWKFICDNKEKSCNLSIETFATKCNVSRTTILRFSKKLGLNGYSELKYCLKNTYQKENIQNNKDNLDIDLLCNNYINLIDDMKKRDFSNICKMLRDSNNIFLVATGYIQKGAAREMKRLFYSINRFIHIVEGESEINLLLNAITNKDMIIIISNSGSSEEIYKLCMKLKVKNVPILSITQLETNRLALISDENLYIVAKKFNYNEDKIYYSTTIIYLLVELLFVKFLNYMNESIT